MFRVLPLRVGLILFIIFVGYYFNFSSLEFEWTQVSGICEEFSEKEQEKDGGIYVHTECVKGINLKEDLKINYLFDFPTILLQIIITFCGSWFRKGNLINKLERASHLSKDVGEFSAALGAILVFNMAFNEAAITTAFGVVFLSYFWGHFFGIILITIANYLKTQEENELVTP